MSYFDVRIPGLDLLVVQADGNNVQPVKVDEFRIAVAETYDVIVRPTKDRAYTIFAGSIDQSGYARATIALREGMQAEVPGRNKQPLPTMAVMGMRSEEHTSELQSQKRMLYAVYCLKNKTIASHQPHDQPGKTNLSRQVHSYYYTFN